MPCQTSAAHSVSRGGHSFKSAVGTHRRIDRRHQLNLKVSTADIAEFKRFADSLGLSQAEAFRRLLSVGTHLASYEVNQNSSEETSVVRSTEVPAPAVGTSVPSAAAAVETPPSAEDVEALRAELAAVREAFPRMCPRPPNRADARNVLRHARRAVPDASPGEIAWFIRGRVRHGQSWHSWGGVVMAAGDYTGHAVNRITGTLSHPQTPQVYGPSFGQWLDSQGLSEPGDRAAYDALWERFFTETMQL